MENISPPPQSSESTSKACEKCKNFSSACVFRTRFLCKNCINEAVSHRFRANLRTVCRVEQNDEVLVCASGGPNSAAMIELFRNSFDEKKKKKISLTIRVLTVSEDGFEEEKENIENNSNNDNNSKVKKIDNFENIKKFCEENGFKFYVINLYDIISPQSSQLSSKERKKIFLKIFNRIPENGGFRLNFIKICIRKLIFEFAMKNNIKKVFFGGSGQSMVKKAFHDIVTGGGVNVKHNIIRYDNTFFDGKIEVLRPLQDFCETDILNFNKFNNVSNLIFQNNILSKESEKVDSILTDFFRILQSQKETVQTVVKTAEKLSDNINKEKCIFCLEFRDKCKSELELGKCLLSINNNLENNISNDKDNNNIIVDNVNNKFNEINEKLCYSCKRMFINFLKEYDDNSELNTIL